MIMTAHLRKTMLTLALTSFCMIVSAKDIWVHGHRFRIRIVFTKNNEDDRLKDKTLLLYRMAHGKPHYLLKHTRYTKTGDCNNIFEDFGSYRIAGNRLIFTTHTVQRGFDPIPEWREEVYEVRGTGQLIHLYDRSKFRHEGWKMAGKSMRGSMQTNTSPE